MLNTVETPASSFREHWRNRRRGRGAQVIIYTGKLLRMFVYQTDWKVLPMAALIAAMVSMVIRKDFFLTMEGDLKGAFALTCVCIWNGCFNSIQVICRERNVLKREHRAGLHITSYVMSHMLYQALLCLAQTILTLFVLEKMEVKFPSEGLITRWFMVDIGISMFLMSYAADMLSLLVSAIAHTTTTAMTVMPFVLIFQLVFSGGIFNLPAWSQTVSRFTISNYGLKCIAAQSDYNHTPMVTAWNTLVKLWDNEVGGTISVGQVLDFLSDEQNALLNQYRDTEIDATATVGQIWDAAKSSSGFQELREQKVDATLTVGEIMDMLESSSVLEKLRSQGILGTSVGEIIHTLSETIKDSGLRDYSVGRVFTVGELLDTIHAEELAEAFRDVQLGGKLTVGELIRMITENKDLQAMRDREITLKTTVGKLVETIGVDTVKDLVQNRTAAVSRVAAYDYTEDNILYYWGVLGTFAVVFSLLAVLALEFIDKDKR